eukprot:754030-Rhodomonas_salina.1
MTQLPVDSPRSRLGQSARSRTRCTHGAWHPDAMHRLRVRLHQHIPTYAVARVIKYYINGAASRCRAQPRWRLSGRRQGSSKPRLGTRSYLAWYPPGTRLVPAWYPPGTRQ